MSGTPIVPSATDSQKNTKRLIAWLTGLLTLALAVFSFVLSFNALTDLAQQHQFSIPVLFPLTVEAAVVIFSLNALYRSIHNESTKWQWALIIGSSLLAGAFNIAHALADPLSRVMAAMPSLFLLLSFETFLGQVRYAFTRVQVVQSLAELEQKLIERRSAWETEQSDHQARIDQLTETKQALESTIQDLSADIAELQARQQAMTAANMATLEVANTVRAGKKQQAQETLLAYLAEHPNASMTEAGTAIGRSKSTVSDYLTELQATGRLVKNGQGWEVADDR